MKKHNIKNLHSSRLWKNRRPLQLSASMASSSEQTSTNTGFRDR